MIFSDEISDFESKLLINAYNNNIDFNENVLEFSIFPLLFLFNSINLN